MSEMLRIFNSDYQESGTATRQQVHREGLWHETFHCWLYRYHDQRLEVLLQHRSATKADFANQLDISAAGHLLATESVADGVREIQEELGLNMTFEELQPLGVFPMEYEVEGFIDREFTHIFACEIQAEMADFTLQTSEVQGMYYCPLAELEELLTGSLDSLTVKGFKAIDGRNLKHQLVVAKHDICAQSMSYYHYLFAEMKKKYRYY